MSKFLDSMEKPISRQQAWQNKQRENGNCPVCGKPAVEGKAMCAFHLEKQRQRYWDKKEGK